MRRLLSACFGWLLLGPAAIAAEITVMPAQRAGEAVILVNGEIAYEDRETFLAKISPFHSGMVVFNSKGGSVYAGIEIGRSIRLRNFATWVPSEQVCASACAIAWLGGTPRAMGADALIGFHAAWRIDKEKGEPVESGAGNALVGAYLAQLGLSQEAIYYLTRTRPESMTWLTPVQADAVGISLKVYDPKPTQPRSPEPPKTSSLELRARDFVIALNVFLSGPNEKFIALLPGLYADPVTYYGTLKPRSEVITQIENFTQRWPTRAYAVNPTSVKVSCDDAAQQCRIEGMIDFDARNSVTNRRSHGSASFEYLLAFRAGAQWPTIVSENGKVTNRQIEALADVNSAPVGRRPRPEMPP